MWAVGPDADEPWFAINAKTERGAITSYINQHGGQRTSMTAIRVAAWDVLAKVTSVDWFNSGENITARCETCEGLTCPDERGRVIDNMVFCEDCAGGTDA